ncbi:elicitor-responsive protein 3-like isoform X2 [Salvia miltiorrhiza]|uniref:elicitor-responsive protein 3-like isoform X2 n=1 Tax=Salvia miltiorrhiza TaxID=226208 RepID=UPI0025AB9BFD|nr:elicitor-responsive protein 3-like isoform X2 [Salvia miltiorrhiza]
MVVFVVIALTTTFHVFRHIIHNEHLSLSLSQIEYYAINLPKGTFLVQMPQGTLEVVLVDANGLESTDFLSSTDAYAIIKCQDQEKTSKVASVEGSAPTWNETFMFSISEGVKELKIRIMDKDTLSADDFVGEVTVPLEPAFEAERVPTTMYNVVKDGTLCGGLNVSLKFTHQNIRSRGFSSEDLGGWKSSSAMD